MEITISGQLQFGSTSAGRDSFELVGHAAYGEMSRKAILTSPDQFLPIPLSPQYGYGSKPCTPGEPQKCWDLWMFIPLKMYL
jgi:hypothetical protein